MKSFFHRTAMDSLIFGHGKTIVPDVQRNGGMQQRASHGSRKVPLERVQQESPEKRDLYGIVDLYIIV
jgi:hypothetical protein